MMTKRNIIKIVLSVAGGLIIGSLGTIIIISQTQHVLTEEEYKEYNTLNDKKNLIEAYSIFYQSTGDLLRYITYNMLTENDIKRINELSHKSKAEGLTDEEKAEQKKLREEYVAAIKGNIRSQLENTKVVDENGNEVDLKRRKDV